MYNLDGQVAIVTGAGSGLGRAIALRLSREGAAIAATDLNAEAAEKLMVEIKAQIKSGLSIQMDVSVEKDVERTVRQTLENFGRIDILVNNAGINIPQWATEVTEEAWDGVINLNLKGLFFCCQAVGKVMIQQRKGKIINVSSTMGSVGLERRAAYSSSKAGVNLLTKVLAIEWAPYQINVNAIAPTFVETPLTKPMFEEKGFRDSVLGNIPLGRIAQPKDVAGAIIYLASEASNMVTGHVLLIDGGWTAR
jgi:NAD(P)-dependent dehydrogenase (short-subunit alcohol dehydrogenase family)